MTTAQTYKDDDDDDDDVNEGVTLFAKDDRGYSALHVAALFGQTQMVELLVDLGALVNAADHYGRTPLHLVCMRGGQKAVRDRERWMDIKYSCETKLKLFHTDSYIYVHVDDRP